MKTIFTLLSVLFFSNLSTAQSSAPLQQKAPAVKTEAAATAPDVLVLEESQYDFGKIPQGKPVTHEFQIKNTGADPLILDNVQASCGCTTPVWSKEAIAPGAIAKITVGYNAQNEGAFTKPVTITYNGDQSKQIIIKGEVWSTPAASAPSNNNVNALRED